jgi:DNA polymerase II small subunit/DNA polymerase delta subunit B
MDAKQHILAQFLREGVLLSPEALEKITEANTEQMLEKAKAARSLVFSMQETAGLSVTVRKFQRKLKLTPQDFAKYYNSRFEGLRSILEKKVGAVSVANAKKSGNQVTTIGMMRETTPRGFIIEDTTGWAEVITKAEDVVPDDVIALKGGVKEEKLFAEEIVWPDVPMSHKSTRPSLEIMLAEKDGHKGMVVITPEAVFDPFGKKHSLPNPGWITITKDGTDVAILVYRPEKPVAEKEVLAWLRKRHLCPSKEQIRGTEDPFLIEPIPDVVWIVQTEKFKESYKGVIIVSSDGKELAKVSLEAGDVEFQG